jgi:hypothetical protein
MYTTVQLIHVAKQDLFGCKNCFCFSHKKKFGVLGKVYLVDFNIFNKKTAFPVATSKYLEFPIGVA